MKSVVMIAFVMLIVFGFGLVIPFAHTADGGSSDVVTFSVLVVDYDSGQPIGGASVYLVAGETGFTDISGLTNGSGLFLSPPLEEGWGGRVDASAVGYRDSASSWDYEDVSPLYTNGSVVVIRLTLKVFSTCDANGVEKTVFNLGEDVYVKGQGFGVSDVGYSIYTFVVEHTNWTDGMRMPPRVLGTLAIADVDDNGVLVFGGWDDEPSSGVVLIWGQANATGKYDVVMKDPCVVDFERGPFPPPGNYSSSADFLASFEVVSPEFVVPEFWFGTIMGLTACIVGIGVFWFSKRGRVYSITT